MPSRRLTFESTLIACLSSEFHGESGILLRLACDAHIDYFWNDEWATHNAFRRLTSSKIELLHVMRYSLQNTILWKIFFNCHYNCFGGVSSWPCVVSYISLSFILVGVQSIHLFGHEPVYVRYVLNANLQSSSSITALLVRDFSLVALSSIVFSVFGLTLRYYKPYFKSAPKLWNALAWQSLLDLTTSAALVYAI